MAGHLASLLLAMFFAVMAVSLLADIHFWVLLLCLCAVVVRGFLFLGWYNHSPGKRMIDLLALLATVALIFTSADMDLLHIMVNLLLLACALKLLLLTKRRDFYQLIICGVFLIACGFIFYQSLFRSLFYAANLAFLLFILIAAHSPNASKANQRNSTAVLLLQSMPIAILLFLFIPRLPPLWQMPESRSSETGLSESITPGDVAELTKSQALAFNASFQGEFPAASQRYWRALSLENFDGKSWSVSDKRRVARAQLQRIPREFQPNVSGAPIRYEIIAEPTKQKWLYAIDTAVTDSPASDQAIWQGWDYQLSSIQPVFSRFAYSVASYPQTPRNQGIAGIDNELNLQVPGAGNPRTQAWAHELRSRYPDSRDYANSIMAYFKSQRYTYTLNPQPMLENPVDEFMFDAKAGFCAHYASAMAYALRLAGIPARVVTGYQGGTQINDNTLSVYQYDAHAWVEAILDDQGWQRFDPTTMVAPARISDGFENAVKYSGELFGESPFQGIGQWQVFNYLKMLSAQVDFIWSRWFLGYDEENQTDLLKQFIGEITPLRMAVFTSSLCVVIAAMLLIYFLPAWRKSASLTRHQKLYFSAVKLVEKRTGIAREHQSARRYCERVTTSLSTDASACFSSLTALFERGEYRELTEDVAGQMKVQLTSLRQLLSRTRRYQ